MRESVVFGNPPSDRLARGRRRNPRPDIQDFDDFRDERERPVFGERDGHTRRGDPRPRRGGKHGCDRVRGQGTRRRID